MADLPKLMRLSTAPGGAKLRFKSMKAREELARLYEFDVQVLADDASMVMGDWLGKPACVALQLPDDSERYFHGLVCAVGVADEMDDGVEYRLVLRPWLWLLTRRADNRVFQDMTVEAIAKKVFEPFGVDYKFNVKRTLPKYEYCVQYRETDFNFVSRLFEREGLYYYFEHVASKHTLVIVDAPSAHQNCHGGHKFRYRASTDRGLDEEVITQWHSRRVIQTGKSTLTDFNFTTPKTSLLKSHSSTIDKAPKNLEVYDYPGEYPTAADGAGYAQLRSEASDARHRLIDGAGVLRAMACGYKFELAEHSNRAENVAHLTLATDIEMGIAGYEAGSDEDYFRCRFSAAPASVPFRPERVTPQAVVNGPHTATVVGPAGEEVYVDEYGRVKIQFHWDRQGKKDANSSCFVRVAQSSAGKGFGLLVLPRIGHEVVVEFLEGNPDRPIIVGSVYNADNMPPYALPDNKSVMTLKSRSFKGGAADYNELRFDDATGKEYLMLRAQKDRHDIVQNDLRSDIGNNEQHTVGKDSALTIGESLDTTVGKNNALTIGESMMLKVGKNVQVSSGGTYGTTVSQNYTVDAGGSFSMKAGTAVDLVAGTNVGAEAGVNVHIKGGVNVVIEAGMQLTIKAGASSVVLGPDGVSITGMLVKINSGGGPGSGSGAKPVKPTKPKDAKKPPAQPDPLKGKHR
jgi:type VI secretion system secreted protein VgrG